MFLLKVMARDDLPIVSNVTQNRPRVEDSNQEIEVLGLRIF